MKSNSNTSPCSITANLLYNKNNNPYPSRQNQYTSTSKSNKIAIISAIQMRKNANSQKPQPLSSIKNHDIMFNQKSRDRALRINTYQNQAKFQSLKKQPILNKSNHFDMRNLSQKVKVKTESTQMSKEIKEQNQRSWFKEQKQNQSAIQSQSNQFRPSSSSIGKIRKNKTAKSSMISAIKKQSIYQTSHEDLETQNSVLYLGRHKKLSLQNKAIDQLLRMKILNISRPTPIQGNKSRSTSNYASMNNSKINYIIHQSKIDENIGNVGVTDKKLHQFQEKYKEMVREYDLKKKLLNQELGGYKNLHKPKYENHQFMSKQNRQNVDQDLNYRIGKIRQNLTNKSQQKNKNHQLQLQQKFKLYQQRCNKYQQLSKETISIERKQQRIERVSKSQNKFFNKKDQKIKSFIQVKYNQQTQQNQQNQENRQEECRNLRSIQLEKIKILQNANLCKDFFNLISKQIQKDQEVRALKHHMKCSEAQDKQKIKRQIMQIVKNEIQISEQQLIDHLDLSNQEYDPFFVIKQIQLTQLVNRLSSAIKICQQFWRKFIFQSLTEEEVAQVVKILKFDLQNQNQMDLKVFAREIGFNLNKSKIVRSRDLYRIYRRILLNSQAQKNDIEKKDDSQIKNLEIISKKAFITTFKQKR